MNLAHLAARARGRWQRSAARYAFRRPLVIDSPVPFVSFTFDDFPRSAWRTGGQILKDHGVRGTYYASFGLMGTTAPTGPIFLPEDVPPLLEQGHELGCHTYSHSDAWETDVAEFEASVAANQRTLDRMIPGATFETFSYPISPPRPATKRNMGRQFAGCRGGGQTFNAGTTDLSYLAAYFIEQSRGSLDALKQLIDRNQQARGWLIFATHDICASPTPYGCIPALFEAVVRYSVESGARIVPVLKALEEIRIAASRRTSPT